VKYKLSEKKDPEKVKISDESSRKLTHCDKVIS
jgi:hypothetical protein